MFSFFLYSLFLHIISSFLYMIVPFLFLYWFTDHCHWVETQLGKINIISYIYIYISYGQMGAYGGAFGWALCYKPEGHRFDSRWGSEGFFIDLIHPAAPWPRD